MALLQEAARRGVDSGSGFKVLMSRIMPEDGVLDHAYERSAKALFVSGMHQCPRVVLNGEPLDAHVTSGKRAGVPY